MGQNKVEIGEGQMGGLISIFVSKAMQKWLRKKVNKNAEFDLRSLQIVENENKTEALVTAKISIDKLSKADMLKILVK